MFLKDVFGEFFGSVNLFKRDATKKIANAVTDLDIDVAIAAHENWKLRLRTFLSGKSTENFIPEEICFDDRCDLGKWIHSSGRAKLGAFPGFTALMEHHKMFHYAASNVVALAQAGKYDDAERMLDVQFAQHSAEVMRDLKKLKELSKA